MKKDFYNEVEKLTKDLVSIDSIVSKGSESEVAKFIYDYYKELDYFKDNPDHLILQETENDEIKRHNTLCLLKGKGNNTGETVVLMGHIDTVGVDDYGFLKEFAFSPDDLINKLKGENLDPQTKKDLDSGEYMFGRGTLDMKSGVAVQMALVKYFSENLEQLNGNIIAIAECDEEDSSHGIVSALDILNKWKKDFNLDYLVAVNSDFYTPMYDGDDNKYIYLGTVGKLLPAFFIGGVETHVGKAFAGLDPIMIATEINKRLNLNTNFCDTSQGETTLPPVCLQLRDLKTKYDVQTPASSNSYYNYSTHSQSPLEVIEKMKKLAEESVEFTLNSIDEEHKKWCEISNKEYSKVNWDVKVYTWREYEEKLIEEKGAYYTNYINEFKKKLNFGNPELSITDFSLKVIEKAYSNFSKGNEPVVIVYYGSPYYQNVEITGRDEKESRVIKTVEDTISKASDFTKENILLKYFYPYISDSSFMFLPKDGEGIKSYKDNFPSWGIKYEHPIEKINSISMPVVNIGTYGNDGHKYTERVHKTYTFETLPRLIKNFIEIILD